MTDMPLPTKPEPAWLTAAADQRLALMAEKLGETGPAGIAMLAGYEVIMTTLSEPDEGSSVPEIAYWHQSCEHCGAFCPEDLVCGHVERQLFGRTVLVVYGACPTCAGMQ